MRQQWRLRAACQGMPTKWFHPVSGAPKKVALEACEFCPVKQECLDFVLSVEDPSARAGLWGGMTAEERKRKFDRGEVLEAPEYCSRGHELTGDNVFGTNRCRKCISEMAEWKRSARTHCKHGHPWVEENIAVRSGKQVCRQCERDRSNARNRKVS